MNIPMLALLLQGIPEQIAVVLLAFVIAKIPLDWKKISLIGVILAFSAYLFRRLSLPFGIHTVFLVILLSSILFKLSKGNLSLSLTASLLSFLALSIFEWVSLSLLMKLFHITLTELSTRQFLRITFGESQVIFLFLFSFLLHQFSSKKRGSV